MDHVDAPDYEKMNKSELLEEIKKLNQQLLDDEEAHRNYKDVTREKSHQKDLQAMELEHYISTLESEISEMTNNMKAFKQTLTTIISKDKSEDKLVIRLIDDANYNLSNVDEKALEKKGQVLKFKTTLTEMIVRDKSEETLAVKKRDEVYVVSEMPRDNAIIPVFNHNSIF